MTDCPWLPALEQAPEAGREQPSSESLRFPGFAHAPPHQSHGRLVARSMCPTAKHPYRLPQNPFQGLWSCSSEGPLEPVCDSY